MTVSQDVRVKGVIVQIFLAKIRAFIVPKRVQVLMLTVEEQNKTRKLLDERLEKIVEVATEGQER